MKARSTRGIWGAWENYISEECRMLDRAAICCVERNHDHAEHMQKSKPDFSGFFRHAASGLGFVGGTHIVFDAKATDKASLSLADKVVKPHQIEHLNKADAAGGVAFLYVLRVRDESKWVFPMWYVNEIGGVRRSLPFEHEPFRKLKGEHWVQTVARLTREQEWQF